MNRLPPPKKRGLRERLRKIKLFIRDPAAWSAEWYREKNTYDCVAVRQDQWKTGDPEGGGGR